MTIDEAIKDICGKHFPQYTYIFDDEFNIDQAISREKLPAIAHVLPIGGTMVMRNGRIYDRENIYIGFVDKVTRDASGDDQRKVFERMKDAAKDFIRITNKSGHFKSVTAWDYGVVYNQMASIVTGVMLSITIEDNGTC